MPSPRNPSLLRRFLAQLGRALDPAAADRQRLNTLVEELRQRERRNADRISKRLEALEGAVADVATAISATQRQGAEVRAIALRHRDVLTRYLEQSRLDTVGAK